MPDKCIFCGYWTIMEYTKVINGLNIVCTHCKKVNFMKGSKREINIYLSSLKKTLKPLIEKYSALNNLKNPGDHIIVSPQDSG
jgi:hypothetical protein